MTWGCGKHAIDSPPHNPPVIARRPVFSLAPAGPGGCIARFMSTPTQEKIAPWHEGWECARALLKPGLVLQAAAVALVLTYYFIPAARGGFNWLANAKSHGGYAYSALSTTLFGGLLPFLYLRAQPETRATHPWTHMPFILLFWAWKGVEVDLWYRILGVVIGNEATAGTVVGKVLVDQFLYNPLWAAPIGNIPYAWKDAGFRWGPVIADLRKKRWYARRVVPVLLAVWMIWIPAVACIFSLPAPLQVPLFSVVLCFWSLLFASLTGRQNRDAPAVG